LSSWSTARWIHDETQRIVAHFAMVTATSDKGRRAPVGPHRQSRVQHGFRPGTFDNAYEIILVVPVSARRASRLMSVETAEAAAQPPAMLLDGKATDGP